MSPECVCSTRDKKFDYVMKKCKKPCEKDDDCLNDGKCTGYGEFKFCTCLHGTEGDLCSEVTECKNNDICGTSSGTTCTFNSTQMQAVCKCLDTSKQIDYKEKICKAPCKNDTDCETGHKCMGDQISKFCECIPGNTVNLCSHVTDCNEPDSCGIGNDTTCEYNTVQKKAKCQCLNSSKQFNYRDKICQEPCRESNCENGGKCTGHGDFKFCECLPRTAGDFCSEVTDCNEADFCGEGRDTTCMYNSTRFEAMCQCLDSSKQFDYKERVCKKTCREGDCKNGANCTLSEGFAFCECLPGTAGDVCSEVLECKTDHFCGTQNDSICTFDSLRKEAICQCSNPNKQFDYKEKICKLSCEEGDCKNGGNCTEFRDSKLCDCLPGTSGDYCSEITECNDANFCGSDNDSTCVYDSFRMEAVCQCSNVRKEFDYQNKICKEPCQEGDCKNGGNCTEHGDFKFCECLPGTSGDFCSEITKCKSENFCGIDEDSTCTYDTLRMEASCQCSYFSKKFDYEEKICKECDCGHNGTCALDVIGEKECSCNEGFAQFSGWCEECSCGSGGNCSFDSNGRKMCACNTGFKDLNGNCERILLGKSKGSTFSALIGSLFAFLIIVFSGLFYTRWRKQKTGLAFRFQKLKESVGEEYEQRVYLK